MTRSTRPVVSSGSRAGVGAHTNETRFARPNAKRENQRAISVSKPELRPRTSMYPNGGVSHLTPMIHRCRFFTAAGSRGSVAADVRPALGAAMVVVGADGR